LNIARVHVTNGDLQSPEGIGAQVFSRSGKIKGSRFILLPLLFLTPQRGPIWALGSEGATLMWIVKGRTL